MLARRSGTPRPRQFKLDLMTGRATQIGVIGKAPSLVVFAALSAPKAG